MYPPLRRVVGTLARLTTLSVQPVQAFWTNLGQDLDKPHPDQEPLVRTALCIILPRTRWLCSHHERLVDRHGLRRGIFIGDEFNDRADTPLRDAGGVFKLFDIGSSDRRPSARMCQATMTLGG